MAAIFDELLLKGIKAGQIPAREQAARDWYRAEAQKYKNLSETNFMKDSKGSLTDRPLVGHMYFMYYHAKHRDTLPYYDFFPLVFPYKKTPDGFMGINLHYLPLQYRAKLMDALYDITNNKTFDDTTKLKLSYAVLDSAAKYRYFKPCVKRYLTTQIRSRFLHVHPTEWDIALFLPLEKFRGAKKQTVWKDSKKIIGKP